MGLGIGQQLETPSLQLRRAQPFSTTGYQKGSDGQCEYRKE